MNPREWARKHWEVVKAYGEGEDVQFLEDGKWEDVNPKWLSDYFYRTKPEPKYIPYGPDDADKLWGRKAKSKATGKVYIIVEISDDGVFLYGYGYIGFQFLFDYFLDVTLPGEEVPFGKVVEE